MSSVNSIIKSIKSTSQKSRFYRRAVSQFLYTKRNQCGMFCSLYWEYELKILLVSVKLAYSGNYFTEKHARRQLNMTYSIAEIATFQLFFNSSAECFKNY